MESSEHIFTFVWPSLFPSTGMERSAEVHSLVVCGNSIACSQGFLLRPEEQQRQVSCFVCSKVPICSPNWLLFPCLSLLSARGRECYKEVRGAGICTAGTCRGVLLLSLPLSMSAKAALSRGTHTARKWVSTETCQVLSHTAGKAWASLILTHCYLFRHEGPACAFRCS